MQLSLTGKQYLSSPNHIRYSFNLKHAPLTVIYIEPLHNGKLLNWSFNHEPLENQYGPPYFVYNVYSMNDAPMEFWLEIEVYKYL